LLACTHACFSFGCVVLFFYLYSLFFSLHSHTHLASLMVHVCPRPLALFSQHRWWKELEARKGTSCTIQMWDYTHL
jgi:hypothetical protein